MEAAAEAQGRPLRSEEDAALGIVIEAIGFKAHRGASEPRVRLPVMEDASKVSGL